MLGKTHRLGGIMVGALSPLIIEAVTKTPIQDPAVFVGVAMAGGAIGSLIPDLDHPNSLLSKKLKPVSAIVREFAHHRGITHTLVGWAGFGILSIIISFLCVHVLEKFNSTPEKIFVGLMCGVVLATSASFIMTSLKKHTHLVSKRQSSEVALAGFIVGMVVSFFLTDVVLGYVEVYLIGMTLGYGAHILYDMFTITGVPLMYPISHVDVHLTNMKTGGAIEKIASAISIIVTIAALFALFYFNTIK